MNMKNEKCTHEKHKKDEKKDNKKKSPTKYGTPAKTKSRDKVKFVMDKYKEGKLHSGSKTGPQVSNPKQAIAIALSESRKRKK